MSVHAKAGRIRLLLFDVDGVLTDGSVIFHSDGTESKAFHIRDGAGLVWAQRSGLIVGLLSARTSGATTQRAAQLGIKVVSQGLSNKLQGYEEILSQHGLADEDVAFMGDDLLDLPVIARAGLSAAPADAVAEVRERVDWISTAPGGRGAVREFVEMVMQAQGRWDALVRDYIGQA